MSSNDAWIGWVAQSINDSGKHLNTLTVSFVALLTYALVTTASIDHGDILVGRKVVLPLLTVQVPLHHFFWFVALFITALHAHIIIHIRQLRDKIVAAYPRQLKVPEEIRPKNIFNPYPVIWLVKPDPLDRRKAKVIKALYVLVYALAPLATLALMQRHMLPSRRVSLAIILSGAILADAILVSIGLPVDFKEGQDGRHRLRYVLAGISSLLLMANITIVFWPLRGCSWGEIIRWELTVDSTHLVGVEGPLELRKRDLRKGRFVGVDMSNADLSGADLRGTVFTSTVMKGATFLPADIPRRQWEQWTEQQRRAEIERIQAETCRPMAGKECDDKWDRNITRLEGTDFSNADLTNASLALTRLADVNLEGANLTSADLSGAMAQRANLGRVQASDARLFLTQLDRAFADHANLSGADMRGVSAVGATFIGTNLSGAQLTESVLRASVLVDANAQGADLTGASLQGADLRGAELMSTTGLDLQQVVATHANLSRAVMDSIGGRSPFLTDLRAAQQHDLARSGSALIIEPDLTTNKDQDDLLIQPYAQSLLVDPQSWPGNSLGPRELYCKIAFALQKLEVAQQAGSVPGSYLSAALEEIARGERVPRIRALEKALGDDEYCQDVGSR